MSQQVTSNIVISDITHNGDFWDNDYCITSLSGHLSYLEIDARVFTLFILYIARFIQKHAIESHLIKQFSLIIGVDFLM